MISFTYQYLEPINFVEMDEYCWIELFLLDIKTFICVPSNDCQIELLVIHINTWINSNE